MGNVKHVRVLRSLTVFDSTRYHYNLVYGRTPCVCVCTDFK